MNLKEARQNYTDLSSILSTVNRQVALAGIAIVWIFVIKNNGIYTVDSKLLLPLGCFVLGLSLDMIQYIYSTAVWGLYSRYKEKSGIKDDEEVSPLKYINWPTIVFFWLKIISVLVGYFLILNIIF